jgi:hypothetical protein
MQVKCGITDLGMTKQKLAVTAACIHELRIIGQEFADTVDFPKPRGGMDIDDCAARDEIVRKFRTSAIEDAEAASPPAGTLVDIGAGIEQHVDDLAVLLLNSSNDGWRIKAVVRQWLIDAGFERRVTNQDISDERRVVGFDSGSKRFDRFF